MAIKKRDLNAEINLVSFISLLSVCICFLLLTAVWIKIGSLNVKQAVGGQAQTGGTPPPSLWALVKKDGALELRLEKGPTKARALAKILLPGVSGKPDLIGLEKHVLQVKATVPALNMALVVPSADSVYEDIIGLMDKLKQTGITDLGVSPL